jgi:hypothetical protein
LRIAKGRENVLSHVSAVVINLNHRENLGGDVLEISLFEAFSQIHTTTTATNLYLNNT